MSVRNLTRCARALSLKAFLPEGVEQQNSTDWRDDGGEREREREREKRVRRYNFSRGRKKELPILESGSKIF